MEIKNKQEDILRQKKMILNYKICYAKNNINKKKFPYVTSLKPEEIVKLTDNMSEEYPGMKITKILPILEERLTKEHIKN